jgi:hypothetical protein
VRDPGDFLFCLFMISYRRSWDDDAYIEIYQGRALTDELRIATFAELAVIICDIMFLSIFPVASGKTWTRNGPSSERFCIGFLNGILQQVMVFALDHLTFTGAEHDLDDSRLEFNKSASKSSKHAKEFMGDAFDRIKVVIMLVADEVFRFLTLVFMSFSRLREYTPGKPSNIQVCASDSRSPLFGALSHLRQLMRGKTSRLVLIYRFRGCDSVAEWVRKFPGDAELLVQSISVASATIQRRARKFFQKKGWQLLCMGDPDMPSHLGDAISVNFAKSKEHELEGGLEMRFMRRHKEIVQAIGGVESLAVSVRSDSGMLSRASWSDEG